MVKTWPCSSMGLLVRWVRAGQRTAWGESQGAASSVSEERKRKDDVAAVCSCVLGGYGEDSRRDSQQEDKR